ncbi:hypothetical protein PR202_ga08042 [Eleusine coracana subsp. coracana]|uniref:Uncharacterized protein n=1 Tax=Eleusine coracana subsp. coracana TaxID=191504 RepID=A0AAV5C269_ELECO|nr:hypothetical protein PR202_ga08042 [Eleusine coracana subsp. coracana]
MALQPWAAFLSVVVCTVLFLITVRRRGHGARRYNLPPGPRQWPVIGNLNLIGRLPHRSIRNLSSRYGPLMTLRFGSFPVVVGSSVHAARFFLKTHDLSFLDRPMMASGRYTFYNSSDMLWAPYGSYWRQARRLWQVKLLSTRRIKDMRHVREEELRLMLCDLSMASTDGRVVNLRDCLLMLSLNVMSRMVLGKKYVVEGPGGSSPTTPEEFRWMVEELIFLNTALNIGDMIPWLDWLDLQGYVKRMKQLHAMFDKFLDHVVDEHDKRRRREGDKFVAADMVDHLLQLADDPSLEVPIDRNGVKGFTLDLIAAGMDTTAITIEWAMSEVLRKPDTLARATKELDSIVGRERLVTEEDIPNLPYLEAVVKEAMRLHPFAPLLAPRMAREDTSLDGYDIPSGTRVFVNAWAIARDTSLWGHTADEFRPERFLGSSIDVKGNDFQLLPFGSGRRMCPGINLGLKMVQVTLANLLHAFAWRLPNGLTTEGLNMEEGSGISIPRKVQLEVVPQAKLPGRLLYE